MAKKKSYSLKSFIKASGYPITSKKYCCAHRKANKEEQAKFGKKAFRELGKIGRSLPKGELLGSHTKEGDILISKKVPKKLRKNVAYHEKMEHSFMK